MPDSVAQPLDALRRIWRSAFGSTRVAYVSGPITTGRLFLDWWENSGSTLKPDSPEYAATIRAKVIAPNEEQLKLTAELLRARGSEPVVEPASLFVSHWSQREYLDLWESFITDHASRILLMDGWEFSAGCASEFCRAHLEGLPTARIDGTPLVARDGIEAIRRALAEVEALEPVPGYLAETLRTTALRLEEMLPKVVFVPGGGMPRKDASLDRLAELINVAQFVSYEAGSRQAKASLLSGAGRKRQTQSSRASGRRRRRCSPEVPTARSTFAVSLPRVRSAASSSTA